MRREPMKTERSTGEPDRQRPPTLKTIAYMTGYSVTAVSRALRDAPDISRETKERVSFAARQVGYRPSRAALRLRTGRTQVISLILDIDEEIMGITAQMVNGISQHLRATNYHLVVTPYTHRDDPMDPVRYVVETGSADGVILSRIEPHDRRVAFLRKHDMPFATHGRTDMGIEHPWHDFDNESFAYDSTLWAARHGAGRVALLGPPMNLSYAHHMWHGFNRAVAEANLVAVPLGEITVDDTLDRVEAHIAAIMAGPDRPQAIICGAASAAMAATSGLEACGLRLGEDVLIASKQSTRILERFRPQIHTVHEDVEEAGRGLADFVLRSIGGEPPCGLQTLTYR